MSSNPDKRLSSLDAFRGLTVALMILVNSPGSESGYSWLAHADWNGCTLADLVFPSFLWAMGVSAVLSLTRRLASGQVSSSIVGQALKRSFLILAFGLISSWVFFIGGSTDHFRFSGVLQRIAVCFLGCALLFLTARPKTWALLAAIFLIGYPILLSHAAAPGHARGDLSPEGNFAFYLDRKFLGRHIMYDTGDPEGLLSTLPAFAGSIIGMLAGTFLFSARLLFRKSEVLAGAGAVLAVLGWVWGLWLPLNKNLWTSSFALFSTGTAMMIFSGFLLAETRGLRFSALEVFGRNALLSYFGSGLIYGIFDFTDLKLWVNSRLFAGWMSPQNASLAFALALTGFCWGGVSLLERRGLTLKI